MYIFITNAWPKIPKCVTTLIKLVVYYYIDHFDFNLPLLNEIVLGVLSAIERDNISYEQTLTEALLDSLKDLDKESCE